jgi:ubiquinone/menaquinone biosynthesis C-methylase UbiE
MDLHKVAEHFSTPEQVHAMSDRVATRLFIWEQRVVNEYFPPGGKLLNIGCGCGREAFALHELGYEVTGIDISVGQIRQAQTLASAYSMLPSRFQVCDGLSLAFPDQFFDCVIAWSQVIGNVSRFEDRVAFLSECHRVLRKQGQCVFSGHVQDYCRRAHRDLVRHDVFFPFGFDSCQWHLFSQEEMKELAEKAGMKVLYCCNTIEWGSPEDKQVLVCIAQKQ